MRLQLVILFLLLVGFVGAAPDANEVRIKIEKLDTLNVEINGKAYSYADIIRDTLDSDAAANALFQQASGYYEIAKFVRNPYIKRLEQAGELKGKIGGAGESIEKVSKDEEKILDVQRRYGKDIDNYLKEGYYDIDPAVVYAIIASEGIDKYSDFNKIKELIKKLNMYLGNYKKYTAKDEIVILEYVVTTTDGYNNKLYFYDNILKENGIKSDDKIYKGLEWNPYATTFLNGDNICIKVTKEFFPNLNDEQAKAKFYEIMKKTEEIISLEATAEIVINKQEEKPVEKLSGLMTDDQLKIRIREVKDKYERYINMYLKENDKTKSIDSSIIIAIIAVEGLNKYPNAVDVDRLIEHIIIYDGKGWYKDYNDKNNIVILDVIADDLIYGKKEFGSFTYKILLYGGFKDPENQKLITFNEVKILAVEGDLKDSARKALVDLHYPGLKEKAQDGKLTEDNKKDLDLLIHNIFNLADNAIQAKTLVPSLKGEENIIKTTITRPSDIQKIRGGVMNPELVKKIWDVDQAIGPKIKKISGDKINPAIVYGIVAVEGLDLYKNNENELINLVDHLARLNDIIIDINTYDKSDKEKILIAYYKDYSPITPITENILNDEGTEGLTWDKIEIEMKTTRGKTTMHEIYPEDSSDNIKKKIDGIIKFVNNVWEAKSEAEVLLSYNIREKPTTLDEFKKDLAGSEKPEEKEDTKSAARKKGYKKAIEKVKNEEDWSTAIETSSAAYGIDKELIYGFIAAESNGDPNAISWSGCAGLMQICIGSEDKDIITKITNCKCTIVKGICTKPKCNPKNDDRLDPVLSIQAGTSLFSEKKESFRGYADADNLAVLAYNAGEGTVKDLCDYYKDLADGDAKKVTAEQISDELSEAVKNENVPEGVQDIIKRRINYYNKHPTLVDGKVKEMSKYSQRVLEATEIAKEVLKDKGVLERTRDWFTTFGGDKGLKEETSEEAITYVAEADLSQEYNTGMVFDATQLVEEEEVPV